MFLEEIKLEKYLQVRNKMFSVTSDKLMISGTDPAKKLPISITTDKKINMLASLILNLYCYNSFHFRLKIINYPLVYITYKQYVDTSFVRSTTIQP